MYTISPAFIAALQSSGHTLRVHMDVLDTDFNVVAQFRDIGSVSPNAEDSLIDGNVDVDVTRLTRRTFTASVLNPDGIWTPGSDWGGMFYVNRLVRFWRGIDFGTSSELVPIGTFYIDYADVSVERNMSVVALSGSDQWKRFTKSGIVATGHSWGPGTSINSIIEFLAGVTGIDRLALDPLNNRDSEDRELHTKLAIERGDNRGAVIAKLCADYGIDIYFDTMGVLTTQDFSAPGDRAVVYTYDPTKNNNLLTVKASYTDDNLYNEVLVVGSANKDAIVTGRVTDRDPLSVTNIDRLGQRLFLYESDSIGTASLALKTAEKLFYKHVLINEDITLEVICNPAYEGNDVIRAVEGDFSNLASNYRLKAFTVPLSTSKQTLRMMREIKLT